MTLPSGKFVWNTAETAARIAADAAETAARIAADASEATTRAAQDAMIRHDLGGAPGAILDDWSVLATGTTTARTLAERFSDAVNVLDFGADPTGVADSAPAINAAMAFAAAKGGGTVFAPSGTYRLASTVDGAIDNNCNYILARDNVQFMGEGDATVLKVADGENLTKLWNVFLKWDGVLTNAAFRNFKIDGNAANNLLTAGMTARSNSFIRAFGGQNVLVDNVTFTGCPGNNPVMIQGTGAVGGDNVVRNCRFTNMGSAIPGNYNTDHSDVYLTGSRNRVVGNYFKSDAPVFGAMWELHGSDGVAEGNYGSGYVIGCYVVNSNGPLITTAIRGNTLFDVDSPVSFATQGNNGVELGLVVIENNYFEECATHRLSADPYGLFFVYFPDGIGTPIDTLIVRGNQFVGKSAETIPALFLGQTRNVEIDGNTFTGFTNHVAVASNALLASGNALDSLRITNNVMKDARAAAIITGGPAFRIGWIEVLGNRISSSTPVLAAGMTFQHGAGGGRVVGNSVTDYAYDFGSMPGMSTVYFEHRLGSASGVPWDPDNGYCAVGSRMTRSLGASFIEYTKAQQDINEWSAELWTPGSADVASTWQVGDRAWNLTVGSGVNADIVGWICVASPHTWKPMAKLGLTSASHAVDVVGTYPTAAEFNNLLARLIAAGLMDPE